MDSYNSPTTKPLFKGTQVVWYVLSVIEVILAFRFMLKLLGANPEAGFTSFIYAISWPFACCGDYRICPALKASQSSQYQRDADRGINLLINSCN